MFLLFIPKNIFLLTNKKIGIIILVQKKQQKGEKMLKKSLIGTAALMIAGTSLFAALDMKVKNNNTNPASYKKVMQEIRQIRSYGLYPINNAEKKQISKIAGVPEKNIEYLGKRKSPIKGVVEYYIIMEGRPIVLYKDLNKDFYMVGYLFNKNGKNLTADAVRKVFTRIQTKQFKNFFNQIEKKAPDFVIKIKGDNPKGGKVVLYVDPQCPYCQRFEKKLNGLEYLKKHFGEIYIVEYPLPFHREAKKRAFWIINKVKKAKTSEEKIKTIEEGSFEEYSKILKDTDKQNNKKLEEELKAMRKIKTPMNFGTPSITNYKGKSIRENVIRKIIINKFHLTPMRTK